MSEFWIKKSPATHRATREKFTIFFNRNVFTAGIAPLQEVTQPRQLTSTAGTSTNV